MDNVWLKRDGRGYIERKLFKVWVSLKFCRCGIMCGCGIDISCFSSVVLFLFLLIISDLESSIWKYNNDIWMTADVLCLVRHDR